MEIAQMAPATIYKNECVEEIISKYTNVVYRVAFEYLKNKYDAEDICQEVFLTYWDKQPVFENEIHEKAWFIKVTVNKCNNLWKMPWNRKKAFMEEEAMEVQSGSIVKDDFTDRLSDNMAISKALSTLMGKERIMIYLFYYEEYKMSEIADILKISENAAYVRLNRIRRKLKRLLKGDYDYGQF